ncbi:MAG: dihydroorotase [Myxococcales bacterium]|nr:dihydroorotase [Myxococcales bacterium]
MRTLTLRQPDDWHLHLRDGAALAAVAPATEAVFARALVMPNLKPPVRTVADALAYRARIKAVAPRLDPLMTLYLTDHTTPGDIAEAAAHPHVVAAKLYPAGATTNSDAGVTDIAALAPVLDAMAEHGLTLCVHGEVTQSDVDVFDREARFLDEVLAPLVARHPGLKVVLEHITTAEGVAFVQAHAANVGGTVTPQHLLLNRNALFEGGLRPHHYCLPVLKRERHRQALAAAVTGGDPRFFLGTDSAPHAQGAKESACGCAGVYSAPFALGLYAEVFEAAGALDRLESFASLNGPAFYGLPANAGTVTLVREADPVPTALPFDDTRIVPFRAGGAVAWRVLPR